MLKSCTRTQFVKPIFALFFMVALSLFCPSAVFSSEPDASAMPQKHEGKARGIDVSHYQGKVIWDLMEPDSLHFVFVKATGGIRFIDPEFHNNWHGTREAGITRGAYHFYYASDDAIDQAEHFVKIVESLKASDLPPVLDLEIPDGANKDVIIEGALTWLKIVERKLGRKPIIYTGHTFANQYLTDERLSNYVLWIAEYDVQVPSVPDTWKGEGWKLWQHSRNGTMEGMTGSVDLSVFNGSLDDLQKFIKEYQAK